MYNNVWNNFIFCIQYWEFQILHHSSTCKLVNSFRIAVYTQMPNFEGVGLPLKGKIMNLT